MVRQVEVQSQPEAKHSEPQNANVFEASISESSENGDPSCLNTGIFSTTPKILEPIPVPSSFFEFDEEKPETSLTGLESTSKLSGEDTSTSNTDVYKTPIPMPAPSSIGNIGCGFLKAFGGNQACMQNNKSLRLPDISVPPCGYTGTRWNNSISDTNSSHRQLEREPGDIGLANLGNTCFMNSGLQCLIHTPPLVEYFLSFENENVHKRGNDGIQPLVHQFHTMMKQAWLGNSSVLSLTDFKNALGNLNAQFKDTHQHDCQEFLAITVDALHEQLKNLKERNPKNQLNEIVTKAKCVLAQESQKKQLEDRSKKKLEALASPKDDADSKKKPALNVREQYTRLEAKSTGWPLSTTPKDSRRKVDKTDVNRKRPPAIETNNHKASIPETDSKGVKRDSDGIICQSNGGVEGLPPTKKRKESPSDLTNKAADHWKDHLASNNTVIASTFQGMFKSTVKCSRCNYVSITYEPFMYLSLPIPRDVDRPLTVTYINMKDRKPQKVDLVINMEYNVAALKQEVAKKVYLQKNVESMREKYVVALVSNYYVHNILDDETQIKAMSERGRNIYVIETNTNFDDEYSMQNSSFPTISNQVPEAAVSSTNSEMNPTTYLDEDWEQEDNNTSLPPLIETTSSADISSTTDNISGEVTMLVDNIEQPERPEELIMCKICLEDISASDVKQHINCNCFLCKECLAKSMLHYEGVNDDIPKKENFLKCAVCCEIVSVTEFLPVGSIAIPPVIVLLLIPVLFRNESDPLSMNSQIFGYPYIVRLPSYISSIDLYKYLADINPFPQVPSKFLIVSSDGKFCARCPRECSGCEIPKVGMISLSQKNIAIVISYNNLSLEVTSEIQPNDMSSVHETLGVNWNLYRQDEPTIDIHDCLKSFSQIEHLDAQNPWYCPECKNNQSATKAMTICHLPDYLIVYLKRFVFLDHSSNKLNNRLKFPLTGLEVREYMAEEFSGKDYTYDLYSCVCHYGGASSGHYTAFGKNPNSGNWHLFNDSTVSYQGPKEEEYASAYILFYERRGATHNIRGLLQNCRSKSFSFEERTRTVGIVSPNHHAGGNFQENVVSKPSAIDSKLYPQVKKDIFNDSENRNADGIDISMDELNLRMSYSKDNINSSNHYPHSIPSLKRALDDDNESVPSNSTDWESEDKGGNSREIPELRSESLIVDGNNSSDSGLEDNRENSTLEEEIISNNGTAPSGKPTNNIPSTTTVNRSRTKTLDLSQN